MRTGVTASLLDGVADEGDVLANAVLAGHRGLRGHLIHQLDVDLATVRWVEGAVGKPGAHGRPHAPALLRPVQLEQNTGAEPLGALLARGAIDALIGSRKPDELGRHPDV